MNETLLDAIVAGRALIAGVEALEATMLSDLLDEALRSAPPGSNGDLPVRALAGEIGAALRVSDRTVQRRLDEAHVLVTRFPATYAALSEGRISHAHATAVVDAGTRITNDDARTGYEQLAVAVAERESVGRVRGIARLLAETILPRPLQERHRDAAVERGVWVTDLDDGMAELRALLPAALAHGILDRLTQMARAVKSAGAGAVGSDAGGGEADADVVSPSDTRTLAHLRADLLADLALTGSPSCPGSGGLDAIRAEILVTVPVLTLAGRADLDGTPATPAMLDGMTPIDPATARHLAGAASGWDRVLTHPITGAVLAVDRYRPSKDLRRYLRATDHHCRFPGCRHPARRCDLDHLHDAARGGPTTDTNLGTECRRHHVLKHTAGWHVHKDKDGTLTWTSPLGRTYPDHPPGTFFTTTPANPPHTTDPPPW